MERSEEGKGKNEENLISDLPKDVIVSILERAPVKDAVRTCVLSTNWRYNWISMKKLSFDQSFYGVMVWEKGLFDEEHAELIHNILLQHSGSLNSFSLYVESDAGKWEDPMTEDFYNRSLYLLSTKGLKECTILNEDKQDQWGYKEGVALKAFPALYSCSEITRLQLDNVAVSLPPAFVGFVNLVSLEFSYVLFCGDSFDCLMSSSWRLEDLKLESCVGPSTFSICSSSIKNLNIRPEKSTNFSIDAIALEALSIVVFPPTTITPLKSFSCLKTFDTFCNDLSDQKLMVCLLQKSWNLSKLQLSIMVPSCVISLAESVKLWEASKEQVKLARLKLLKIILHYCSDEELNIVKVLLSLSPSLQKVEVVQWSSPSVDVEVQQEPLIKLVKFPRASPMAKLVFDGVPTDW